MANHSQVHRSRITLLHAALLACALTATVAAPRAHACSIPSANTAVQGWAMPSFGGESASSASQATSAANGAAAVYSARGAGNAPITGLWKVNFFAHGNANIPDGTVVDAAIATWHADGTELMNSGRAPMTQSFCQGVWERTGTNTYELNHLAMSWTPDGSAYIGPTSIHETVTLSHNATVLTGTFSIVQYATDGTTELGGVVGTLVGTRVYASD